MRGDLSGVQEQDTSRRRVRSEKTLEIVEVSLDGPKAGEVLVEIKATGICHTTPTRWNGLDSEGIFPSILGHEGAGIVHDVGAGVTSVKPGDHVIPLYTPEWPPVQKLPERQDQPLYRDPRTQGKGLMPDGTTRFSYKGERSSTTWLLDVFELYSSARDCRGEDPQGRSFRQELLHRLRRDDGRRRRGKYGEGDAGANVVVFGLGGIGLNVIQGARMVGADKIIGVDVNDSKEEWGRRFGMTDFRQSVQDRRRHRSAPGALTDGGADYTFDCTGTPP